MLKQSLQLRGKYILGVRATPTATAEPDAVLHHLDDPSCGVHPIRVCDQEYVFGADSNFLNDLNHG